MNHGYEKADCLMSENRIVKENNSNRENLTSSDSEERELLQAAQGGSQRAYTALLGMYKPLIASMVKKYRTEEMPDQETEDLREEATVCFCRAVARYDLTQSEVGFGLYAKVCIANGLVSCLREKKRGIPVETLSEAEEEWNDPSSGIIEEENFKALHDLIEDTLTDYENAVWWSYMSGMTAKEIGERFGTGEKSAANAIYRIRKKLRKLFDRK